MSKSRGSIPLFINEDHKHLLRETAITLDHPGPILRDFQTLLDFIGPNGVPAGGQHHLLPINILPTLNQHMTWPIKIDLGRPQLKSYPNLQGLHLLGRATGLVIVQGEGGKERLAVDQIMLTRWTSLNPVEQYFSLLDVWLNHARKAMVGERDYDEPFVDYVIRVWSWLPAKGQHYSHKERSSSNTSCFPDRGRYTLVLMRLFGWLEIEQADPIAGRSWLPASIRHRPFGEAMLAALVPKIPLLSSMRGWADDVADRAEGGKKKSRSKKAAGDADAAPTDGRFHFNFYHSILAPYFPALQDSLAIDLGQPSDGLFIFRISLGKGMWRRITAPAHSTLDDLADAILKSVAFEQDHLWHFSFSNRLGVKVEVRCLDDEIGADDLSADEFEIGELPIRPGDSMVFLFDYGDNWEFKVLLEKIDPPAPRQKLPKLIEKHGPSPEQYSDWDDE
jgi:hypothetical protein